MKRIWIRWALLALAAGPLALPGIAPAEPNVAGTWTGTARGTAGSQQFEEDFTMALVQNGQRVTGTFSDKIAAGGKAKKGRERTNIPIKGTLMGDKLSLTIGKQQTLQATVDGDSMTGTMMRETGMPHHVSAMRAN